VRDKEELDQLNVVLRKVPPEARDQRSKSSTIVPNGQKESISSSTGKKTSRKYPNQ